MLIAFFLIPFIEHLTERTKFWVIDKLKKEWPVYMGHWLAPLFTVMYAIGLLFIISIFTPSVFTVTNVLIASGGSIYWYEVSSLWRETKRKAVPPVTKGLDEELKIE